MFVPGPRDRSRRASVPRPARAGGSPRRSRAARALARAASRLTSWWPLSPAGVGLTILAAASIAFGRSRMDIVLTLAGIFWIALLGLSGLCAALAALVVRGRSRRAAVPHDLPCEATEGRRAGTGFALRRRSVPLAARPRVHWISPPATVDLVRDEARLREHVVPEGRVLADEIVREIVQDDLLGLWRLRWRVRQARACRWLPDPGRLTAADLAACLATGDLISHPYAPARGDLVDARLYTRSDPARLILWKIYARTRQLLVRAPEQARSPDRHPLIFLVAGEGDDAAAAATRLILESGLFGDGARFACDGSPAPVTDREQAMAAVCASADHRERAGADLAVALGDPTVDGEDPVVLIVPSTAGPWQETVRGVVSRRPDRFVVLGAGDAAPPDRGPRGWRRFVFRAPETSGTPLSSMVRALDPFVRAGARVALAERRSGRVLVLAGETHAVVPEMQTA